MMSIEENIERVLEQIRSSAERAHRKKEEITLVVVSKGRAIEQILKCYECGLRDFGESRVDEALAKRAKLPSDIRWHFIGKLQRNKVRKVIGKFALIHSVDSFVLAEKISSLSQLEGVRSGVLLEANTSGELTKGGLMPKQWLGCYQDLLFLPGIEIKGLMTMAPMTQDEGVIQNCFHKLYELQESLKERGSAMQILSMGMSHDFVIAIQEGATLVRIGGAIFSGSHL